MRRSDKRGRSIGSPHVRLDHSVFHSAAFRALAPVERAMLFEITGLYNGHNNGELWVGLRDAAKLVGVADPETASRAIKALIDHGLLAVSSPGHFAIKARHATCYRITFLPTRGAAPTNEYRDWQAEANSQAAARLIATTECNLRSAFSGLSVGKIRTETAKVVRDRCRSVRKIRTVESEKPEIAGSPSVGNIPTQIDCHTVEPDRASISACKTTAGLARTWIEREGYGSQGRLAAAAGLSSSKLSRLLNDPNGRRTLTIAELDRLQAALSNIRGHLRVVA